jgi:hypothetical protein
MYGCCTQDIHGLVVLPLWFWVLVGVVNQSGI